VRPTLFEFAGGEPAFLALAAAHHARCLEDPELNHIRDRSNGWPCDLAADDAELPADASFRAALHAYMRCAVGDVLAYSAEDAVVAPGAVMPRWGWDGLRP
jgi:hemoglobin